MNRLEMIKMAAEKAAAKRKEEADFQASIAVLDARKAEKKAEILEKKISQLEDDNAKKEQ